jgi:hypothetical protein
VPDSAVCLGLVGLCRGSGRQALRAVFDVQFGGESIHCPEHCRFSAAAFWLAASPKGIYNIVVPMFNAALA